MDVMNSYSNATVPWLDKLLTYFECLKDSDDKIENLRSSLCGTESFSPLALFTQIDFYKKSFLTLNDFINFLQDSQINFNENSLRKCIHNFDKDGDFRINFDEYLGIILPRKNESLKQRIFSSLQDGYCPNYVLLEIKKKFCNLLLEELELVKNLNSLAEEITKSKEFTTYQAFMDIVCGDEYITKNNLATFLNKNGIFYSDDEVKQLMFRIDADDDDKISYNEFKEIFFPITDKIVINNKNFVNDFENDDIIYSKFKTRKTNTKPENRKNEYFNKSEIITQNSTYYYSNKDDTNNFNSNIFNKTSKTLNNTYFLPYQSKNSINTSIKNNISNKNNKISKNKNGSMKNIKKSLLDLGNNSLNKSKMFVNNDSNNYYSKNISGFNTTRYYQNPYNDTEDNFNFNNSNLTENGITSSPENKKVRNDYQSIDYKEGLLTERNNRNKSLDYKYSSPYVNKSLTKKFFKLSTNNMNGNNINQTNYYKKKDELLRKYCDEYGNNDNNNNTLNQLFNKTKKESIFFSPPKKTTYYYSTLPVSKENQLNTITVNESVINNRQNILKSPNGKSYNNNYTIYKDTKLDKTNSVSDEAKKNFFNLLNDYIEQTKIAELKKETLANCEDVTPKKICDIFSGGVKQTISTSDLYQALKNLSNKIKPNDIKYILKKYNKNFDDEFTYNEFCELLFPNDEETINSLNQRESYNSYEDLSLDSQQKIVDLFNQIIDGEKSNEEYRTLLSMSCGNYYRDLFESLKSVKTDGLLREDIDNFMSLYGKYLSQQEVELLMEKMDKNKDDVIDYNEFVKAVSPKII